MGQWLSILCTGDRKTCKENHLAIAIVGWNTLCCNHYVPDVWHDVCNFDTELDNKISGTQVAPKSIFPPCEASRIGPQRSPGKRQSRSSKIFIPQKSDNENVSHSFEFKGSPNKNFLTSYTLSDEKNPDILCEAPLAWSLACHIDMINEKDDDGNERQNLITNKRRNSSNKVNIYIRAATKLLAEERSLAKNGMVVDETLEFKKHPPPPPPPNCENDRTTGISKYYF
uniref:Uncharacterized protein n=1 Tax=Aureoumbra lagunensis TaxID=44058 RepID=A0A7S3K571_9STRA|mmetsp:Transcript_17940/g.26966  ORF Transcript_17940/g.26966 Transcript_17940/m.26966 type:complete len:227 (-) Transcript_17940:166-846(-)